MRKITNIIIILFISSAIINAQELSQRITPVDKLNNYFKKLITSVEDYKRNTPPLSNDGFNRSYYYKLSEELLLIGDKFQEYREFVKAKECYQLCLDVIESFYVPDFPTEGNDLKIDNTIGDNTKLTLEILLKLYSRYKTFTTFTEDRTIKDKIMILSKKIDNITSYKGYIYNMTEEADIELESSDGSILLPEIYVFSVRASCMPADTVSYPLGYEYLYGPMGDEVVSLLRGKGQEMKIQGNYKFAESIFIECLNLNKSIFGDINIDVVKSYLDLVSLYSSTKDYDKALECMCEAINRFEMLKTDNSILDIQDECFYILYLEIVDLYLETGRYEEGLSFAKKLFHYSLKKEVRSKPFYSSNIKEMVNKLNVFYDEIMKDTSYRGELDKEYAEFQDSISSIIAIAKFANDSIPGYDDLSGYFILVNYGYADILEDAINFLDYSNTDAHEHYILYREGVFYLVPNDEKFKIDVGIGLIKPKEKYKLIKQHDKVEVIMNRRRYKHIKHIKQHGKMKVLKYNPNEHIQYIEILKKVKKQKSVTFSIPS